MKIITFFNNKGGVGKTTLAVNVASFLATEYKKNILFLDADPQGNSTQMMIPEDDWENYYGEQATASTIMDYLAPLIEGDAGITFVDYVFSKEINRFEVDLIPGHPSLSIIEDILSDAWNKCTGGDLGGFRKTNWLNFMKEHYSDKYDYMLIDVGPSLGALNRSILLNTDYIITPMGSDIFSLIGVSNISKWIKNWMDVYENAIPIVLHKHGQQAVQKYPINFNINSTTRLIGFSIQQYVTRTFKTGRRPIGAYDRIIQKVPDAITTNLGYLIHNGLDINDLNLGDVPYLYSLVPLAQSGKAPMYNLTREDGVVGAQYDSIRQYKEMLNIISTKILKNMGDLDAD
ncbi:ParA family protein [Brevibacillus sp. AG]|uniref:ParA family protein n=1 Tax=Brevibacillus sp. AG TaxID=3020891 RepID=UPI00232B94C6|nr:ParA family protein [Brevibacillus sp. AG]MDC0764938.1 ParA family protein [Brevibacillus sp. AG]